MALVFLANTGEWPADTVWGHDRVANDSIGIDWKVPSIKIVSLLMLNTTNTWRTHLYFNIIFLLRRPMSYNIMMAVNVPQQRYRYSILRFMNGNMNFLTLMLDNVLIDFTAFSKPSIFVAIHGKDINIE